MATIGVCLMTLRFGLLGAEFRVVLLVPRASTSLSLPSMRPPGRRLPTRYRSTRAIAHSDVQQTAGEDRLSVVCGRRVFHIDVEFETSSRRLRFTSISAVPTENCTGACLAELDRRASTPSSTRYRSASAT